MSIITGMALSYRRQRTVELAPYRRFCFSQAVLRAIQPLIDASSVLVVQRGIPPFLSVHVQGTGKVF